MTTFLRIDASSRFSGSHSRDLGDYFETEWVKKNSGARILRRDLVANPIPHIVDKTIAGFYTPPEQVTDEIQKALALSDELISEIKSADVILLTVPMYNFSIPSALKAWIDHIVRIGHTFSFDGKNFSGLVTGKEIYVTAAYGAGGYVNSGPFSAMNFLESYLKAIFGFLGFSDVRFFAVESTTIDPALAAANANRAKSEIQAAV